MERFRRLVASVHVTFLGVVLLVVLVVSSGVALLGSRSLQGPALAAAIVVLFVMVMGAFPGGLRGLRLRPRELSEEARSQVLDEAEDEAAWQRERERRERDHR
jgi:hypothetical protein